MVLSAALRLGRASIYIRLLSDTVRSYFIFLGSTNYHDAFSIRSWERAQMNYTERDFLLNTVFKEYSTRQNMSLTYKKSKFVN